jgi:hypothetical protein
MPSAEGVGSLAGGGDGVGVSDPDDGGAGVGVGVGGTGVGVGVGVGVGGTGVGVGVGGTGVGVGVGGTGVGVGVGGTGVGVTYVTSTVKLPLVELPARSAAEQITVVEPTENSEPERGVHDGVIAPSTASLAVALKLTVAPDGPDASTVMFAGRLRTGGVVSRTMMLKLAEAALPALSVARQVTVVEPSPNTEPERGVQIGVIAPSTASLAAALKLTVAPDSPVASIV